MHILNKRLTTQTIITQFPLRVSQCQQIRIDMKTLILYLSLTGNWLDFYEAYLPSTSKKVKLMSFTRFIVHDDKNLHNWIAFLNSLTRIRSHKTNWDSTSIRVDLLSTVCCKISNWKRIIWFDFGSSRYWRLILPTHTTAVLSSFQPLTIPTCTLNTR